MKFKQRPKRYAWIGDAPPHPDWQDTLLGIEREVWRIVDMPLALPVGGTLRLSPIRAPTGGSLYTVIAKTDDGYDVAFTHTDVDAQKGRFEANQVFGFVGISGLESFDAAG
jgi:hypothetical protein